MELGQTKRSQAIRSYLVDAVASGRKDILADTCSQFSLSREEVRHHLFWLTREGYLELVGTPRKGTYRLGPNRNDCALAKCYSLDGLAEDQVYRQDFAIMVDDLPENIQGIWHYGFTEILNNAIDHSGGENVHVSASRSRYGLKLEIRDDGEGIFKHIARLMQLADPRQSLLELSKGKLTTQPDQHTGEGIFFTSRAFDLFFIFSGELMFVQAGIVGSSPGVILNRQRGKDGTAVHMDLSADTGRTMRSVFDSYTDPETLDFSKTEVPVNLMLREGDQLVSRSQAKRILNRLERFKNVTLDFQGVFSVGRSFVDEIFRVYKERHPEVSIRPVNMLPDVQREVARVVDRN